ncbi:ABC transporter family substrate-binding protein [Streptomyces sp. BPTC-684]|uniref:ABC transporter family substrate-binding protein n=1 Tax=Streptomyces sp. BPTC-684 TaxID=3043734 RepID=UPI0024B204D7|nr:ABC transporter family substrate-binding protein [Streptomyces sp. BPTC-684]WHM36816.1 ABC transporter family substrate-binding protein [Streptomyces sp. BPTC-684]
MPHVGVQRGRASRAIRIVAAIRTVASLRSVALLTSGVLALPALTGCSSDDDAAGAVAVPQDIGAAARPEVADGGTLRWAVDAMPQTLNVFQADADAATARITGAVLPSLFTLDERGRPERNPDYLERAEIVQREPKQVVLYKLNQKAVWSDGREVGAPDFVAQWRALSGRDTAYWTARNAGYERIEKIEKGANDLEVKVTFAKPYADWRALFSPLYPKDVTGTPDAFNDGARTRLKATAGPFLLKASDRDKGTFTLARNPRWWGRPSKLDELVFRTVPRDKRVAALADGSLDVAEIDRSGADRITLAERDKGAGRGNDGPELTHGPGAAITPAAALRSWAIAHGSDEERAETEQRARKQTREAVERYAEEQAGLAGLAIRKSLEPAYTQLALNGGSGPLADERVRRAVARALDRQELAEIVLKPLGLPARPPGSHLALAGQPAYADNSDALGGHDTHEAQALLADAGWTPGGARQKPGTSKAGSKASGANADDDAKRESAGDAGGSNDDGTYIVGDDKGRRFGSGPYSLDGAKVGEGPYYVDGEKPRSGSGARDDQEGGAASDDRPGGSGPGADTHVLAPARAAALQEIALMRQADALEDADHGHKDEAGKRGDGEDARRTEAQRQGGAPGAYAPKGTAAPAAGGPLGKDGKPLTLRFVLPSGAGSEQLRAVGDRIAQMLKDVGISTEITKVADDSYFKDHIASGDFDLALYSWPGTAYPATDDRPVFAKPEPASDGSLVVEQNYTRVGTDHIDQLFDQAAGELDEDEARDLVRKADARIWAAAGSIPLYQRPQLVAVKPNVANAGAFGFAAPHFQDIGFKKAESGPKGSKK